MKISREVEVKETDNISESYRLNSDKREIKNFSYDSENVRVLPLSFSQLQMWVIDQMQPGNHAYNLPVGFRLKGNLNIEFLERSFNEIIRRHETLRTTFGVIKEEPVQLIHPEYYLKINTIDLSNFSDEEQERKTAKYVYREAVKPFDLSSLPLIRVTIIKTAEDKNILILNQHHIISDGWSIGVIFNELSRLYNSSVNMSEADLPDLTGQYSDYVKWQREKKWNPSYNEQLNFWKEHLSGSLPNLELPLDKQRPAVQSLNGSNEFFFLPNPLIQKVQSIGFKKGCTFYMTILAAFQSFLNKYGCGDDIIIGTPVSNRPGKTNENLVGNFINMVAVRADLKDDPDFNTLLQRTQKIAINALTNRDLPFETVVENLKIRRDLSRNPVFQAMLQVLPKFSFELAGLEINNYNFDLGYSQVDISLHLYQAADGYQCRIEYNTDLFEQSTIKRMAANFQVYLNELIQNPALKISEIPFLDPGEKHLMKQWNNTGSDFPADQTIVSLFEKAASEKAYHPAVQSGETILSYRELNSRANTIANYLLKKNVKPGTLVGICMERSTEMAAALLGILKTGAAYLPLDPSFPVDRLAFITEDAGITTLITQEHLVSIFPGYKGQILKIDKEWKYIRSENTDNPDILTEPSSLAYIIYTSGSSGKPKGVLIQHRSVVNFLTSMQKAPGITEKDTLLAVTTISFDISVLELFLPLISGAKVVIATKNDVIDGNILLKLIRRSNATIMQATPSTWKLMIEAGWAKTPQLKMLCGGEALPKDLAVKMIQRGKELWNMYGPTETTVWSSIKKIEADPEFIYIGPPIANTQFYIVDKNMQPVPVGVSGELLIGGEGLAKGYLNRPELNEERFINNPFDNSGSRVYRTGDLARFLSNGDIEFLGRTDFQVKLRGYRIELGEIETILTEFKGIKEAVVAAKQNKNNDTQLIAYIIPSGKTGIILTDVKNFLKKKLPEYMIPSVFINMEKFPLTPNGKIDRKALPEPDSNKIASGTIHAGPGDELEMKLAEIWEKVLGISNIGINDNFFDIGGHSLLAVQMFAELERTMDVRLPLVTLFEHQNISELAAVLKSGKWKEKWSSLIQIKKGTKTPLFLIHGAEGNILVYKDLANHLEEDQSFFALQAKGLDDSEETLTSIEEMASHYLKEIKKVQPKGPYNLGGYCLGGTIAYEMAQQLIEQGEEVKNIFLIETYNICSANVQASNKMTTRDKVENIRFHFDNLMRLKGSDKIKFIINKSEVLQRRIFSDLKALLKKAGINIKDSSENIKATSKLREINDQAQEIYKPKEYQGRTILLKPKINFSSAPDPKFGWENLINGEFKIYNLDIAPRGMLYEPFVKETAAIISEELKI
jgi:amino acid adenylation domain-containing protein